MSSLAATIYYCTTGQVPPQAVERLIEDPLRTPNDLGTNLTAEQETALLWALSLSPKERQQSLAEFLQAFHSQPPVSAPTIMPYCPHCFAPKSGKTCPVCGASLAVTNPDDTLSVGTILTGASGTYWIGEVLGQGSIGITYSAIETQTGRRVTIKEWYFIVYAKREENGCAVLPLAGHATVTSYLKQFCNAAEVMQQMNLPSFVRVLDCFEGNGTAYLVMEYLDGQPLRVYTRQHGPIPVQLLLEKLDPVIRDLGLLHLRGILYREIIPDNLFWTADGTIKVLDSIYLQNMESSLGLPVMLV